MECLEDKLFISERLSNIGQIVGHSFNGLTVIVDIKRTFLNGFDLFFELYSTIVLIVSEQRSERLPEIMYGGSFGENHTLKIVTYGAIYPCLEKKISTRPFGRRDMIHTIMTKEKIG